MAKQAATRRNKIAPLDMTYGFPGDLPHARHEADRTRLLQFFQFVASGMDIQASGKKAGYGVRWCKQTAYTYAKKYKDYLNWLMAHQAQVITKATGIEVAQVLEEMAKIAFANEADYVVIEETAGKKTSRRKAVHELTRDQLTAVTVVVNAKGQLDWKWRDRDGKLFEVGKHLGMFNEKIIMEHRHRHLHATIDLSKIPLNRLEQMEAEFEGFMGVADATR